MTALLPTGAQVLAWFWFLLKLDAVLVGLMVFSRLVGAWIDRQAPHFGNYTESNVIDLEARRTQLSATAQRRAR